jgi:hypothetical protein
MSIQLARRALIAAGIALSWLVAASWGWPVVARAQDGRPTLFVFLQLDVKSSVLEQTLQKQLPALSVTVYGRFRDYQDDVATKHPDAILTTSLLLELEHTKPALQGVRGGKEWEPYVLVTTANNAKAALAGKTIGVVDLLGRDGTQTFATAVLGSNDIKIKRVAKIDDLLPLLEFSAADAVLIPTSAVKRLTERTRLNLVVRELPNAHVGLPSVAIRNDKIRGNVVQALQKLDTGTKALLGIETWSAR